MTAAPDGIHRVRVETRLLRDAREAFLASTTREVQAIGAIDERELEAPGEITAAAAAAFAAHRDELLAAA